MKFDQAAQKASVDSQEYTRALLDQLSEQNNLWKLTLGYLAEREVGNPLVIPSILTENRAYSAPQASIVAIRVVTNQTSGVSITANGSIYIPVGLSYTQVPTGQLNQISVGGLNDGNKVWVQYLDERAAAMSAAGDGNVVQLTGSLAPLTAGPFTLVYSSSYSNFSASTTSYAFLDSSFIRHARSRTILIRNTMNIALAAAPSVYMSDSSIPGGQSINYVDGGGDSIVFPVAPSSGNAWTWVAGRQGEGVGVPMDSAFISMSIGSVAPTSGTLYIYKEETF